MNVVTKIPISLGGGKIVIPKGTKGIIKALSNSKSIRDAFSNLDYKVDGQFYIINFPAFAEEILCDKTQVDIEH